MLKITEAQLRRIIRQEILREAEQTAPSVGKDIKGGAAAEKAVEKITKNPTIVKALEPIDNAAKLAEFIQGMLKAAAAKGINKEEIKAAMTKILQAVGKPA